MNICVFCASSSQIKRSYFEATHKFAKEIASAGYKIVYGGGAKGLMGQLADSTLQYGGNITGIIPNFMCEVEWNHTNLSELIIVSSMHERKQMMAEISDAVVALPGGCGTLEELLEIITWKKLGLYTKPIVIANFEGYYNALIEMLEKTIVENFLREEHKKMWSIVDSPEAILPAIESAFEWNRNAIKIAAQ